MTTDDTMKVALVGGEVWRRAVEMIHEGVVPSDDPSLLLAWEAAGILSVDRELDPHWAKVIAIAQRATTAAEIVSTFRDVAFLATLLVDWSHNLAACFTSRATFTIVDGTSTIEAGHPMIEVSSGPATDVWALIMRVLPPLASARATPIDVPKDSLRAIRLDHSVVPLKLRSDPARAASYLSELAQGNMENVPPLPPELPNALSTTDSVMAIVLSSDTGTTISCDLGWSVGEKLFRFEPGKAVIYEVPHGDIGGQIIAALHTVSGHNT